MTQDLAASHQLRVQVQVKILWCNVKRVCKYKRRSCGVMSSVCVCVQVQEKILRRSGVASSNACVSAQEDPNVKRVCKCKRKSSGVVSSAGAKCM